MIKLDKRGTERSDVHLIVDYRRPSNTKDYLLGITRNYSQEGLCFESNRFDHNPGDSLELMLKHPQSAVMISAVGNVVWKKNGWYKCMTGVRLKKMDRDTILKLRDLVSTARKSSLQPSAVLRERGSTRGKENWPFFKVREIEKSKPAPLPAENQDSKRSGEADQPTPGVKPRFLPVPEEPEDQYSGNHRRKWRELLFIVLALLMASAALLVSLLRDTNKTVQLVSGSEPVEQLQIPPHDRGTSDSGEMPSPRETSPVQHTSDIVSGSRDDDTGRLLKSDNGPDPKSSLSLQGTAPPPVFSEEITFDHDSDAISPRFYPGIDRAVSILLSHPGTAVNIEGHSDDIGAEVYNLDLAMRRALEVKKLLLKKGVDRGRIKLMIYGPSNPVASNDTESGRRKNRRVDIRVVPASE